MNYLEVQQEAERVFIETFENHPEDFEVKRLDARNAEHLTVFHTPTSLIVKFYVSFENKMSYSLSGGSSFNTLRPEALKKVYALCQEWLANDKKLLIAKLELQAIKKLTFHYQDK